MEIKGIIKDPVGLHARPAAILTQEANKFESEVTITAGDKNANLKSIMSVMALGIKNGEEVVITASGKDADEALESIEKAMKEQKLI